MSDDSGLAERVARLADTLERMAQMNAPRPAPVGDEGAVNHRAGLCEAYTKAARMARALTKEVGE